MNTKFTKNEKILIYFYLLIIVLLGLSISFSFFLLADSAEKDTTKVYAGRIDVKYKQGENIIAETLYPIPEPDFDEKEKIYKTNFSIATEGTLEQTVQIGFKISKNEFNDDMIRYALYSNDGKKLSTGYLNQGIVVLLDNIYFKEKEEREYVFIIWLEEKSYEQQEQGKKLTGSFVINSKQYGY